MNGKTVLITGASSGLGLASARQLAGLGATVIMVARGQAARETVAKAATGPAPILLQADLSSQAEIRRLAAEAQARFDRIDVLLNNAGAAFPRRQMTIDGIERTFAVNHLAPFLLTTLLLGHLKASPQGRVVTVTADLYPSSLDFGNLQGEKKYGMLSAYFRSKLLNILFTKKLARCLKGTSVTANCCGPGTTKTNFAPSAGGLLRFMAAMTSWMPFVKEPEAGARTQIYLASSPDVASISGGFFLRCRLRKTKPITERADVLAQLWELSSQLCGAALGTGLKPQ
jgi:NAD(P)-dependent dehydrogenase (short-subunit alcohol dehydrogenase family)